MGTGGKYGDSLKFLAGAFDEAFCKQPGRCPVRVSPPVIQYGKVEISNSMNIIGE